MRRGQRKTHHHRRPPHVLLTNSPPPRRAATARRPRVARPRQFATSEPLGEAKIPWARLFAPRPLKLTLPLAAARKTSRGGAEGEVTVLIRTRALIELRVFEGYNLSVLGAPMSTQPFAVVRHGGELLRATAGVGVRKPRTKPPSKAEKKDDDDDDDDDDDAQRETRLCMMVAADGVASSTAERAAATNRAGKNRACFNTTFELSLLSQPQRARYS